MRSFCTLTITLSVVSLCHATLVGVAVDPNSPRPEWGVLYNIDPMTGATTPVNRNFTYYSFGQSYPDGNQFYSYGLGDSPYPATIFGSSPVNLYALNLDTGVRTYYSGNGALDLAYDGDHHILYGTFPRGLVTIPLNPCDGMGCPGIQPVGTFSVPDMWALGYVPGEGLYGVDGLLGMLWRIDPTNAVLSPVGPTGVGWLLNGIGITDIEFDPATGRMIASAGGPEGYGPYPLGPPLASGKIYLLDRTNGSVTLLNDNAPNFFGLAEVTPEPGSFYLSIAGVVLATGCLSRREWRQFRERRRLAR